MFSMDGFMPHAHCFLWRPGLLWSHVAADFVVGISYFSIPLALLSFGRRSQHRSPTLDRLLALFVTFIMLCGTGHFFSILTMWQPQYYLEGLVKILTAMASIGTAVVLWQLIPKALTVLFSLVREQR